MRTLLLFAALVAKTAGESTRHEVAVLNTPQELLSFVEALDVVVVGILDPNHIHAKTHVEMISEVASRNGFLRFGYTHNAEAAKSFGAVPPVLSIVRNKGEQRVHFTEDLTNVDLVDLWVMHKWMGGVTTVTSNRNKAIFTSFTGEANFAMLFVSGPEEAPLAEAAFEQVAADYEHPDIIGSLPKFLLINRMHLIKDSQRRGNSLFNAIATRFIGEDAQDKEYPLMVAVKTKSFEDVETHMFHGDVTDADSTRQFFAQQFAKPPGDWMAGTPSSEVGM